MCTGMRRGRQRRRRKCKTTSLLERQQAKAGMERDTTEGMEESCEGAYQRACVSLISVFRSQQENKHASTTKRIALWGCRACEEKSQRDHWLALHVVMVGVLERRVGKRHHSPKQRVVRHGDAGRERGGCGRGDGARESGGEVTLRGCRAIRVELETSGKYTSRHRMRLLSHRSGSETSRAALQQRSFCTAHAPMRTRRAPPRT